MSHQAVIEEIKQRLDLVDVVSRYVQLKRSGSTYKALCPFHQEKTPSFVVFPHTQTWRCFGACGEGGDIFSFVMKIEGLSFPEALRQLAREAGVELEAPDARTSALQQQRERLRTVCETAMRLFTEWLRAPEGETCRAYLERRRVSPDMVLAFGLGYAPEGWDTLLNAMLAKGYTQQDLLDAGLVIANERGSVYDRFRHRLIFPIRDVRGRVVGFGGRALDDEQQPKYLNSPQTLLFDKGRLLYGLDLAKDAIRREDRVVLVEGYMDVIAAHQAGYRNVVASLGTALTPDQLRLINRFTKNIVLALDADTAGTEAAKRGIHAAREALARHFVPSVEGGRLRPVVEMAGDLRVVRLPAGYDPDDLLKEDPAQWGELVANALPVVEFFIQEAIAGRDLNDAAQKRAVAEGILPIIAEIPNTIERAHYLQRLAFYLHVPEDDLAREMTLLVRQQRTQRRRTPPPPPPTFDAPFDDVPPPPDEEESADIGVEQPTTPRLRVRFDDYEAYLLYLLSQRPDLLAEVEQEITPQDWHSPEWRQLYETLLFDMPMSGAEVEALFEELPDILQRLATDLLNYYHDRPLPDENELIGEVRRTALRIKRAAIERTLKEIAFLVRDAVEENDKARLQSLVATRKALQRQQKEIDQRIRTPDATAAPIPQEEEDDFF
ncbi:DNA primase [Ardenticatena maritima]|uniref:DNA primase n=1 Tax=Ardenticatena maritima TaxID=872965 RepID=A0A0M8K900_9CHLR|nr:DNA primase [Ardenticatena maritima]GAP62939.1 DNA primase [Ardenticatena maritima]